MGGCTAWQTVWVRSMGVCMCCCQELNQDMWLKKVVFFFKLFDLKKSRNQTEGT